MICVKNRNEIAMDRQLWVSPVTEHLDNAPGYFFLNRLIYKCYYARTKKHNNPSTVTQFYLVNWFAIVLG